jgi:hypothetical protein
VSIILLKNPLEVNPDEIDKYGPFHFQEYQNDLNASRFSVPPQAEEEIKQKDLILSGETESKKQRRVVKRQKKEKSRLRWQENTEGFLKIEILETGFSFQILNLTFDYRNWSFIERGSI